MPLNIITKLINKNFLTPSYEKNHARKSVFKLNPIKKHKLGINYVKKSSGNGPNVFDCFAS